ncbi:MAG TPA: DUF5058 family protein [Clostridia bacterium]|nr:DUF5058 family protein [Clostridia bacterium]
MGTGDFKTSSFMYLIGICVILFVIGQSLFFIIKAWKRGKDIGISKADMGNTITSSVLFTVAPAVAVVATVITLASSLGLVLPWIRLSIIGNISYEVTAAESALGAVGFLGGISREVTSKTQFAAIMWVTSIGSCFPLILMPLILKKIQKKIGSTLSTNKKWADVMSAAAFIGLISAFVSRSIAGAGNEDIRGDGAGVLSIITLIFSIAMMLVLEKTASKFKLKWLEPFAMPMSMFFAMGMAMLFAKILPAGIAFIEWRG